jgi:hypothetical protein
MEGGAWSDLPNDVQLQVLDKVPLLKFAKLACLSQAMSAAYERVALREAIISTLPRVLAGGRGSRPVSLGAFLDFQPLLSTALPRDLVGVPEVCIAPLPPVPNMQVSHSTWHSRRCDLCGKFQSFVASDCVFYLIHVGVSGKPGQTTSV